MWYVSVTAADTILVHCPFTEFFECAQDATAGPDLLKKIPVSGVAPQLSSALHAVGSLSSKADGPTSALAATQTTAVTKLLDELENFRRAEPTSADAAEDSKASSKLSLRKSLNMVTGVRHMEIQAQETAKAAAAAMIGALRCALATS